MSEPLENADKRRCPWCDGVMPAMAGQCPHCGRRVGLTQTRKERTQPVNCPACKVPASFMRLAGIQIDCCGRCTGTWYDDGELEALPAELSDRDLAKEAATALDALRAPHSAVLARVEYLDCPICGHGMNRHNYQEVSGIILNRCSGHGTWLDFTNGRALLRLFADGRLHEVQERARAAALEDARRTTAALEAARVWLQADRLEEAMEARGHRGASGGRLVRGLVRASLGLSS